MKWGIIQEKFYNPLSTFKLRSNTVHVQICNMFTLNMQHAICSNHVGIQNFLKNYKKNSEKFCFMNVIIGYISIVLYSDSSWSDTAISPEASFHMTPGKILSKLNILCENCKKSDTKSSPVTWVISEKSLN